MGASSRSDWSPRVATSGDPHEGYRWQVRIRDAEWGLISQKAVARILIAGPKADGRGQRIREEPETNPVELTCFLSTTYGKEERNKPKGDISNFFSSLERN